MKVLEDRYEWQNEFLLKYQTRTDRKFFLLNACTASGKTVAAGKVAKYDLDDNQIDFVIINVPIVELQDSFQEKWKEFFDLELATGLRKDKSPPTEYQGAVLTYGQLPQLVSTIETWARLGVRILYIPDELHHLIDEQTWGYCGTQVHRAAVSTLGTTGTAFRADQTKISFVNYTPDGKAVANHTYSYREAVRDRVCKPIQFMTDDGVAEGLLDGEPFELRISEARSDEDKRKVARVIFDPASAWLAAALERLYSDTINYRQIDGTAGSLIIGRPGRDQYDEKHVRQLAARASGIFRCPIKAVTHDDDAARLEIARFRKNTDLAMAAVRMITEGVDIPRLSRALLATTTDSELLFRQIFGRIIRNPTGADDASATGFIAKFPHLAEFATRFEKEAAAGLRDRIHLPPPPPGQPHVFIPLGAMHEPGGAIWGGQSFAANDIEWARQFKTVTPEAGGIPEAIIVKIWRSKPGGEGEDTPTDTSSSDDAPLELRKAAKKKLLTQRVRAYAMALQRQNPTAGPLFDQVYVDLWRALGVKDITDLMDNNPIEKLDEAIAKLDEWIRDLANRSDQ